MTALVSVGIVALLIGGCTMALYEGPRRPTTEVAVVEPADTTIHRIDGREVPYRVSKLELLSGVHSALVSFSRIRPYYGILHRAERSWSPEYVCFRAAAGRTYWTVPVVNLESSTWYPAVIDAATRIPVMVSCAK